MGRVRGGVHARPSPRRKGLVVSLIGKPRPLPITIAPVYAPPLRGDMRVGDPKLVLTRIEWRSDWGDTGKCSIGTFLADNRESLSARDRQALHDIREGQTISVMGGGATVTYPKRVWR